MDSIEPLAGKAALAVRHGNARLNVWEGAVRSGKTVSSLIAWVLFVATGPAGNLVMVGKTERTLKRNIIDPLVEWLGARNCRYVAGSGELWICGRRIYVAGANDERAQDKLRGITLAGAYVDEITVIPESFWSMLLTRLSIPCARLFGTTNPDNPSHWLMRDYLSKPSLWVTADGGVVRDPDGMDLARFSFRLADNPTLSAAYVDALAREFTGLWRSRFIDGAWTIAEGAVYPMWDPQVHVADTLPTDDSGVTSIERWIVSLDYGTTNPFHALLLGVGHDDRIWVVDEYRWDSKVKGRQLTDVEYSAALRTWLDSVTARGSMVDRLEAIIVDPSAASFIAQLHRDGWARVRGADNTVLDGIRDVSSLLAGDRLRVHGCPGLVDELPGYVWDPKAAQRGEDKPLKENDHGADALRYGIRALRRYWRHWTITDLDQAA